MLLLLLFCHSARYWHCKQHQQLEEMIVFKTVSVANFFEMQCYVSCFSKLYQLQTLNSEYIYFG